jgi:signal transduction histidine kinase
MTASGRAWWRPRLPQTVRARLTVLYAVLFLAAGATLLGITYGLVAGTLPTTSSISRAKLNILKVTCKAEAQQQRVSSTGKPQPRSVPESCRNAFALGANVGASNQRQSTLDHLAWLFLLGLGVMTFGSAGLGWVMAGRVLRPVRAITETAQRASEEHLGERLRLSGPEDELKQLADTFDDMLDRLDAAFASQRRFVADASHELRTPLTVMRTAIDVTLAKPDPSPAQLTVMAEKVRRYIDQAEVLIDALLTLARSGTEPVAPETVDLAAAARTALEHAATAADEAHLRVVADLEPAPATGDPVLLGRLVANLVDNAVAHNEEGGWVQVGTGVERGSAYVRVSNSGPVIAPDMVDSLFEPFRRVAARTNGGVGLGLAIVRSIAVAHGATIDARSRTSGGLSVSVEIPNSAEPPPSPDEGGTTDPEPAGDTQPQVVSSDTVPS